MKAIYFILTIPFFCLAKIFNIFNILNINNDLNKCITYISRLNLRVDEQTLKVLFVAEDHRVHAHYGVDQYAMLRAIYSTHIKKEFQGASTIAQQYVRVVTSRYERTLIRKMREQLLAILVCRKFDSYKIASAYLSIAFLGSGMNGIEQYQKRKNLRYGHMCMAEKISMIARLKYPEPMLNKGQWSIKLKIRIGNIEKKLMKL